MNMMNRVENIAVIGAGSWGTALANRLVCNGHNVRLWSYESELVEEINRYHRNSLFLPDVELHPMLRSTGNLGEAITGCGIVLLVTPVQVMSVVLKQLVVHLTEDMLVANASKGIELATLRTVSQICEANLQSNITEHYVVFSGPTFAREVAQNLPSLIVAASKDETSAKRIQSAFSCKELRVYTNTDVMGVELGGAVKNVIAIAAGICDGLGFGCNARAALITRGLAEMKRLGRAMGADASTFAGLAGMGDLVLTCTGELSRNRTVGFKLGQGMRLNNILAEMKMVAEGVKTAESVYQLAQKCEIEMPIVKNTYQILHQDKPAKDAVMELMSRALKAEQ